MSRYQRMKRLLEKTGLSFNEGGISSAELHAYAKGAELLEEFIDNAEGEIFPLGRDEGEIIRFADMLGIDRGRYATREELKSEIIRLLSLKFGRSSFSEVEAAFSRVGSGEYYFIDSGCILVATKLGDLKEAGKFLRAYASPFASAVYSGDGERLTFDMWDSIAYTFNTYDSLGLTCEFLESLRSDIFEQ